MRGDSAVAMVADLVKLLIKLLIISPAAHAPTMNIAMVTLCAFICIVFPAYS